MNKLDNIRKRQYQLKIEFLNVVKQIGECDPQDVTLYQDIATCYGKHLLELQKKCKEDSGISICHCTCSSK